MAVSYQLVIDCTSPELLAHFWAEALRYVVARPPSGVDFWDDFYRSIGVPEHELCTSPDRIEDPNGEGPRIWFQIVPEKKSIKNRIHIDVTPAVAAMCHSTPGTRGSRPRRLGSCLSVLCDCVRTSRRAWTITRSR